MSVLELQSKYFPIQPRGGRFVSSGSSMGIIAATTTGDTSTEKPIVRLREPRDLYSTTSLQHPPKWPIECQVIPEKIRHIETVPAKLEHFYISSNSEPQPKPVGEEMGTVLYDYQPKLSVDYFCRSCVGGSEVLQSFESEPNALKFESRFESGNLAKAIKVTNVYYELYLRQDMYTDRHSQWFYFRIQNTKENLLYRFSIVNFNKPDSLYRYGLKILMYSEKESQLNKIGWVRCGQNISYFKNDTPSEENGALYTLTFNLKFRHSNDTVYLAHCYPYTYSTLQNYLRTIEDDSFKCELLTVRLLCRSLAGNNVYIVTITSPDNYQQENQKKPAVVISARVHSGETQSSYMMKGIIDFLTSNCPQAKELRDRFIFKLIPMLNPDGVIVGNSRCCLLGQDLNRQYRTVLREAFPQIYQTKVMLRRLIEDNGVFLYCDIHGHSRRNNVFIYGCENRKFPERKLIEQVFPLMMHKNSADKFSFQNCKFRVQKNKEGTGRVFAWTLGVVNSYTLEISLGGSTMQSRQYTHFNTADYEAVGRHFCETLMDFSDPSPVKERLRERILLKLMEGGSNADEPVNVPLTDYSSLSHSESEDSADDTNGTPEKDINNKIIKEPVCSSKRGQTTSFRLVQKRVKQPLPTKMDLRHSLNLNKASVDFIRIGHKQQRILDDLAEEVVISKELAVFKRLTKFRRKTRKTEFPNNIISDREIETAYNSTPRCTSILFDDPFNPPGTRRQNNPNDQFGSRMEEEDGSATEDECDEHDAAITNKTFIPQQNSENELADEFALFSISKFNKKLPTDTVPYQSMKKSTTISFAPFVPKLPQGKPLRSFYSMDLTDDKLSNKIVDKNNYHVSKHIGHETRRRASISSTTSNLTSSLTSERRFLSSKSYSLNKPPPPPPPSESQISFKLTAPRGSKDLNQVQSVSSHVHQSHRRRVSKVDILDSSLKSGVGGSSSGTGRRFSISSDNNLNHSAKCVFKNTQSICVNAGGDKSNKREGTSVCSNSQQQGFNQLSATDLNVLSKKKRSKFKKSKSKKN